ncbi:MAG: exopolyphosphatase [Cytophagia bacterium]|nr:MAG: exopolyphosphatase [Cytophagales bacterium]TAG04557.1 MAG: exopolyphosphatase [Cytophagia bacterium]TAG43391.1 MAG: exopolyphosphatase [Cytophagia bacterium]
MQKKLVLNNTYFNNNAWAVIDLGTNIVKLSLANQKGKKLVYFRNENFPVFIGKDGINKNIIQKDAEIRLFDALDQCQKIIKDENITHYQTFIVATSALRNAENGQEIALKIRQKYNFFIEIISGEKEATLIAEGVKQGFPTINEMILIMDIGGGSVEFVLTNGQKIFWKKSFEIGAARLKEKYHRSEPISDLDLYRLMIFLELELATLREICFQYCPKYLIGTAGTFETLAEIHLLNLGTPDINPHGLVLSMEQFESLHQMLINRTYEQRLQLGGLAEFRAELIVIAVCILRNVLLMTNIDKICVSEYALKEGYLQKVVFTT